MSAPLSPDGAQGALRRAPSPLPSVRKNGGVGVGGGVGWGALGGSLGVGFWGVGSHPGCEHSHGAGGARSESARSVEIRSVQMGRRARGA